MLNVWHNLKSYTSGHCLMGTFKSSRTPSSHQLEWHLQVINTVDWYCWGAWKARRNADKTLFENHILKLAEKDTGKFRKHVNGYAAVGLAFFILVLGCFAGIGFKAEQFLCILAFLELQQHHSTLLFPAVLSSQVFKTDLYANICCFGQGYCDVSHWGAFFSCTNLLPTLELCLEVPTFSNSGRAVCPCTN